MAAQLNAEQRKAGREQRRRERRARFYIERVKAAPSAMDQLRHACDYLRAVAKELPDADITGLATSVARLADERNRA